MTSLSLRNRPTTARPGTRAARATSLLALLAVVGGAAPAVAQAPPPGDAFRPAKGSWQPYQATDPQGTAVSTKPALPASRPVTPPPSTGIGTRVVVFQKPAGDDTPAKADPAQPPATQPPTKDDNKVISRAIASTSGTPDRANVFRLKPQPELEAEILHSLNLDRRKPDFPLLPASSETVSAYVPKTLSYQPSRVSLEPGYVVHRKLLFEDQNAERHLWDIGFAQPFLSAGYAFKDVVLFPGHLTSSLFERYDTSAGKMLPGTPVPYLLYPPQLTVSGSLVEAGVIVGTAALFP